MDDLNLGGLSGGKKGVDEIGGGLDGGVGERLDFDGGVGGKLDFGGGFRERLDFNGGFGERLDFDALNLGSVSGKKKGVDETGGDFDGGVRERLDFDAWNSGSWSGKEKGVDKIGDDFDCGVRERLDFDAWNSGSWSGKEKGVDKIGDDFDGGVRERLDFDALNLGSVSGIEKGVDETGGDFNGGVPEILDFNAWISGSWSGKEKGVDKIGDDFDGGVRERLDFDALNLGSVSGKEKGVDETGGDFNGWVPEILDFDALISGSWSGKEKGVDKIGVDKIGDDFDGGVHERLDFEASNSGSLSGKKKGVDDIGGDLIGGDCERLDFDTSKSCDLSGRKRGIDEIGSGLDGGVCGKRRVGVFDRIDGGSRAGKEVFEKGNEVEILFSGDLERNEVDGVMELEKVRERFCGLEGEKEITFDLNVSVSGGAECVGSSVGVGENAGVTDKECVEVVNISSDDEEEELVVGKDFKGKGKMIDNDSILGSNLGLDLGLDFKKINEVNQAAGGSMSGSSRYTKEEKGKAIDVQPWMPLDEDSTDFDLLYALEHMMDPVPKFDMELPVLFQKNELGVGDLDYLNWQQHVELSLQREQEARELEMRIAQNTREIEIRREELARIAEDLRQREIEHRKRAHRRFARPLEEDEYRGSLENDQNLPLTARNMHREQQLRQSEQPLIRWKPSENRENNVAKRFVPSLVDLSLNGLANNADMIVSLEGVPYLLKQRLSNLLCDSRKMNIRVLDLFVRDSPEEIRIKDASWITEHLFRRSFGNFSPKNLKVFQLDLGGQCVSDDIIAETLARSSSSLPGLGIISLRGACRLSDEGLKVIVKLAPALCSINLGECSLLTHVGINYIADALGNSLRELFIDNCSRVDAKNMASAVAKFKHLEVLSVAGIPDLCDGVICDIISACGRNIKDLDLADCERLTDSSLKIIGQNCSDLCALNIVNLHSLTNVGLSYLANGCKSIRSLKLGRNKFSDEAIANFIEIAGRSLEELSLNHVRQVGPFTALSLAKFSRKLLSLDLSWCRKVTDEALGLIVDSCWSLKLLKLFGCTQITNVFLDGHSNSLVKIIGLDMTSLLERVGMLKTEEVYLRYSPLPIPCRSEDLDHRDV